MLGGQRLTVVGVLQTLVPLPEGLRDRLAWQVVVDWFIQCQEEIRLPCGGIVPRVMNSGGGWEGGWPPGGCSEVLGGVDHVGPSIGM